MSTVEGLSVHLSMKGNTMNENTLSLLSKFYPPFPTKPALSEIPGVMAERWAEYDRKVSAYNRWCDVMKQVHNRMNSAF